MVAQMPVEISLAKASVRIAGVDAAISGHTLALALFLAAEGRPVSRERLGAALFHADSRTRENAVKVYVHRLRSVIGKDAIVRRADGYVYSPFVRVDLPEIEAFVDYAIDEAAPTSALRARARNMLAEFSIGRPDSVLRWNWFAPVERKLRALERRLRALCA
jgi:hypothetical protein